MSQLATAPPAAAEDAGIRPCQIDVPETELVDLRRRIVETRWPDRETVGDSSQGPRLADLQEYTRYVAQGGDWGAGVVEAMGRRAPKGLLGIHTNLPAALTPEVEAALSGSEPAMSSFSEKERAAVDDLRTYLQNGGLSYLVMMGARPQAVGYGLTDSPIGLAGWMLVHGGFAKSAYGEDPEQSPTLDDVLDDFSLYWLTNTATSAARIYWENRAENLISAVSQKSAEIKVPVAITAFPDEVVHVQESWARRAFPTLGYFHEADQGGHFAAWEQPELFAAELRAAFRPLR